MATLAASAPYVSGAIARGVHHAAGAGGQLRFGHIPGLRGRGDEQLPSGGAHPAQRVPIGRRGRAAAGALRAVLGFVEVGLLDLDVLPIDVQLIGDDHGQMGLDALADLGILGHDGHDAVGA